MNKFVGSLCLLLFGVVQIASTATVDASAFCFACSGRRNNKDLYADPEDCHSFYQCFYVNGTYAQGHRRTCPKFQFWSEKLLTCVPEAAGQPCRDPCQLGDGAKCYAADSQSCSSFFMCANTASYPICCPHGTSFDKNSCSCELDATCTDPCRMPEAFSQTTPEGPVNQVIDEAKQVCQDATGSFLRSNSERPGTYWLYQFSKGSDPTLLNFGDRQRVLQQCPAGLNFNFRSCGCTDETSERPVFRKQSCSLYLPFDFDLRDHSIEGFAVATQGKPVLDNSTKQNGDSSLKLQASDSIEIPGLKTASFSNGATWCFFYRFGQQGSILTNADHLQKELFSIKVDVLDDQSIRVQLAFFNPTSTILLQSSVSDQNAFQQVCVVLEAQQASLYLNKELADRQDLSNVGQLDIGHCPYVLGGFEGHLDEVLICPWPLRQSDIEAHFNGQQSMGNAGLIIPDLTVVRLNPTQEQLKTEQDLERGGLLTDFASKIGMSQVKKLKRSKRIKRQTTDENNTVSFGEFGTAPRASFQVPGLVLITGRTRGDIKYENGSARKAFTFSCNGALIRDQWVLTSAECLNDVYWDRVKELYALLGFNDYEAMPLSYTTGRRVAAVTFHGARFNERRFDYALVKLSHAVRFSNTILPMAISDEYPDNSTCSNITTDFDANFIDTPDMKEGMINSVGVAFLESFKTANSGEFAVVAMQETVVPWSFCKTSVTFTEAYGKLDDTKMCTKASLHLPPLQPTVLIADTVYDKIKVVLGIYQSVSDTKKHHIWTRTCRCSDWIQMVTQGVKGDVKKFIWHKNKNDLNLYLKINDNKTMVNISRVPEA